MSDVQAILKTEIEGYPVILQWRHVLFFFRESNLVTTAARN